MKIQLYNTPHGLIPMYDEDFDAKKRLVIGQSYLADVRMMRNYKFLQKAFTLVQTAWVLLPEITRVSLKSFDCFRDTITVAAGYVDVFYDMRRRAWCEKPKSWAFDKMDETEFSDLYERMKDVIWSILMKKRPDLTHDQFYSLLANY